MVVGDEADADLPERAALPEQTAQRAQVAQLRLQPRVAEEFVDPDLDGVDLVGHVLDVVESGAGQAGRKPLARGQLRACSEQRQVGVELGQLRPVGVGRGWHREPPRLLLQHRGVVAERFPHQPVVGMALAGRPGEAAEIEGGRVVREG